MSDQLERIRQYSFAAGPNYSDSVLTLAETECEQSDNLYFDGQLRTVPGASRLIATAMANTVVGLSQYNKSTGSSYFLAASAGGRLAYQNGTTWTNVSTGLPSTANTFYNWVTFNDTHVVLNGSTPKMFDGTTLSDLGGSPPNARFGSVHGDYVLLSGQTANPSQVQYCDTATLQSWPGGNVLNIGLDDGQILSGQVKFGDATVFFKERSIYLLSGSTASDFTVNPTISDIGCISPNSICLTDLGIFFWSEIGPAIFNGYKTIPLHRRMRAILDTVNWDAPLAINATYYPYRKQIFVSYPIVGSSIPQRFLIFDLYRLGQDQTPVAFWPGLFGTTASTSAVDSTGRKRAYFGTTDGYVLTYDDGTTTWNGAAITGRVRSRAYASKQGLTEVGGLRLTEAWFGGTTTRVALKVSVDGGTFVTHGQSPFSITGNTTTTRLCHVQADGDGSGSLKVGRSFQLQWSLTGSTPFSLHGHEIALEPLSPRRSPGP